MGLELFHRLADRSSARVRLFVVEHQMEGAVRFCNVDFPTHEAALRLHGGDSVPALWDGQALITGAEAIIARLAAHGDVGRY